jgi:glutamate synthase domain-containing protein 1
MRSSRPVEPPLYDARFEHDACGVGFVADAGGRSRDRVLELALDGLAALGHRGAFAADGASSDGAGVTLPLEPGLMERIAPGLDRRVGVVMAFLPRGRTGRERARAALAEALAAERLAVEGWRTVPTDPSALGPQAARSRPFVAQAFASAPRGWSAARLELALCLARRRFEAAVRGSRLRGA